MSLKTKDLRNGKNRVSDIQKFKSAQEWLKWWWKSVNHKCRGCSNSCKQSSRVKIVKCPQFKNKEKADE